jgi:hypothetical protein
VNKLKSFAQTLNSTPTTEIAAGQWLEERLSKAQDGVFSEIIELNPILAKHFLKHNADNRPIRPAKLRQFVDDITGKRWELNGEPLIFASTGQMNDGQHRCEAVIQAGRSIQTLIVYGVKRESRTTIDNGSARTPGDHLAIEGHQYAHDIAAIARLIIAFERAQGKNINQAARISATEIVDRCIKDKRIESAAIDSRTGYGKVKSIGSPSVLGFCWYICAGIDEEGAGEFMRSVITGANLGEDSAAYVTRERLIQLDRPLRAHRAEIIFHGFNAFIQQRKVTRITVRGEFPPLTKTASPELPIEEGQTKPKKGRKAKTSEPELALDKAA